MGLLDRFRVPDPGGELTCAQVAKVLQSTLDGESADVTADAVAAHLEACARCGLDADTYLAIKAALARSPRSSLSHEATQRLRSFGDAILAGEVGTDPPGTG